MDGGQQTADRGRQQDGLSSLSGEADRQRMGNESTNGDRGPQTADRGTGDGRQRQRVGWTVDDR
jgi:hypothetical protein